MNEISCDNTAGDKKSARKKDRFSRFFRAVKFILFIILLVPFVCWLGGLYESASEHNVINRWNHRRFGEFYELPENSLDLVFIGSSHSYCTFDPEFFDDFFGINSYQLGMPLQHPDSTYYTLLEVLKTQKPSVVVMELYWDMMGSPFNLKQAAALFEVLRDDATVDDYIKNVFPLSEKVKYFFLPIRYQPDFFAYRSSLILKCLDETYGLKKQANEIPGEEYYKTGGFIYCTYNIPDEKFTYANQFLNLDGKKWTFDPVQQKYVRLIIELCEKNDIRLAFVTAPVANVSMEHIKNYGAIHEQIAKFAREAGVSYIDYNIVNMEENLLTNENFRDDAHVNYSGAVIVMEHFANWLTDVFGNPPWR